MKLAPHYTSQDIREALQRLGVGQGDTVYVTGNLGNLGYHESMSKIGTLQAHLQALQDTIGPDGNLVVPTHSFKLCNTTTPFDLDSTPGERGPLAEYVRMRPGAVRQFHPFASLTALGAHARDLCYDTTRHAYGPNSPYDRMLAADAWFISIAMLPRTTCSLIHHMEMQMGVPYRYTKEFLHPVVRSGQIVTEPFYLFVTYQGADLVRDQNIKLFQHPSLEEHVIQVPLGMNSLWAYRMRVFESAARDCMSKDIYSWLRQPPERRPYRH